MLWHYNEKIYIFISIILAFLKKTKYNKLEYLNIIVEKEKYEKERVIILSKFSVYGTNTYFGC